MKWVYSLSATLVLIVGVLVFAGNRMDDTWHHFLHGNDRVTFHHRHYNLAPTNGRIQDTAQLHPTGESSWGQPIYVGEGETGLPAEVFIKESNGTFSAYELSGGF
jgi:hypothetical protein